MHTGRPGLPDRIRATVRRLRARGSRALDPGAAAELQLERLASGERLAAAERSHLHSLEAVIGAMDEGIAVIGPDGVVTVANAALSAMAGGVVATREGLEQAFGTVLRDGEVNVSGPDRTIAVRILDVGDPVGTSTLVLARDITERRREEAARDAFMGVLSHELRTPVTTILGFAQIMSRPGFDVAKGNEAGLLADLAAEATRLAQLIEDLLVLSRAQSGRMAIDVEPVLVDRLIGDAVEVEKARYPRLRFELDIEGRLPPVDGDMTYLGQVLRNMLDNAGKYGPIDGVVRIRASASEDSVTVAVLDEGPGFDAQEGPRLFEMFYRSARTAGTQAGSGIGMYVARALIEAMGGTIWARLRPEGGAEFGFSLPIIDVTDLDTEWTPRGADRRLGTAGPDGPDNGSA